MLKSRHTGVDPRALREVKVLPKVIVTAYVVDLAVLSAVYHSFEHRGELFEADPERSAECSQFHYVDPALTPFAFADERLGFPNPLGQVHLRKPGPPPGLPENLEEEGVLGRVDRFFHCEPGAMELT